MQNGTDIVNVNVINRTNDDKIFVFYNNHSMLTSFNPSDNDSNGSIVAVNDNDEDQSGSVIPDLFIWRFISIFILIGILLNCITIFILFRAKSNGTRYFLLQLSICDLGTLLFSLLELHYTNNRRWLLPDILCPIYLGFESFTNTATIYFIIAINFHAISMHNLILKNSQRQQNKLINNSNINEPDEYTELAIDNDNVNDQNTQSSTLSSVPTTTRQQTDEDNYEIAITDIEQNQKRSLTIDYSKKKSPSISVILPTLFIWFLSASISIPFFAFGNVIPINEMTPPSSPLLCGIMNIDKHNNHLMQILVLLIRVIISTGCLYFTLISIILKIFFIKTNNINNEFHNKDDNDDDYNKLNENVQTMLKLAFVLTISYLVLSLQKIYGSLYFEIVSVPSLMHFKYPFMKKRYGFVLSIINLLLPLFRPIIYFFIIHKKLRTSLDLKRN